VTLPVLSRVATEGITDKFRSVLGAGNRLVLFLTLPAAVGLFVLAEPIISIIYEHGKFSAWETTQTAAALRWYSVGLIFYSGIKVIQPAFTAIDRRFVPMYVALGSIALNAGLNSLFVYYFHFGHEYLALSTAVISAVNFSVLYHSMRRTAGGLYSGQLVATLLKLLPGTFALGLVAWAGVHWGLSEWAHSGFLRRAISLGLIMAAAGSAYIVLAMAFKVEEADEFVVMLKRRAARGGSRKR
jgi:putative peptidoglycan lipid II flippase